MLAEYVDQSMLAVSITSAGNDVSFQHSSRRRCDTRIASKAAGWEPKYPIMSSRQVVESRSGRSRQRANMSSFGTVRITRQIAAGRD